jgi:NMD protein affecting ribosome stability and mRNA decay
MDFLPSQMCLLPHVINTSQKGISEKEGDSEYKFSHLHYLVHYCTQQIIEKHEKIMQIWIFHFSLLQFKFPNKGL